MRAFVAVTLPESTRTALASACEAFKQATPDWAGEKWVPCENLHVTLRFIGPLEEETVPAVGEALAAACRRVQPFKLTLGDVAPAPGGRRARMLWARFAEGSHPAAAAADAIDTALAETIGLPSEPRPFTPHVTLARLRAPRKVPPDALGAANDFLRSLALSHDTADGASPAIVSVRHVTLMSSRLTSSGASYEEVLKVRLGSD